MLKMIGKFNVEDFGYAYDKERRFKMILISEFDDKNKEIGRKVIYFYVSDKKSDRTEYQSIHVVPAFDNIRVVEYWYSKNNYSKYDCCEFLNEKGFIEVDVRKIY